ncbi:hypothetical protein GYMLUDRAFT_64538 [Collybiopsis luxurians FD-317 M1]|uniref:Uncharacterized protein n=1 Tax=Collybiopsis luxurians FD-317 M1 TaxID=944289 RepID=A0A0D0ANW3_9AGAR|nr:hypothetical protein GYMLUDRAFT_64538 [Collybiopsis luxurians FD-317 M1]
MYALLALTLSKRPVSATPIGSSNSRSKTTAKIAGGVVGSVAFIAILALAIFVYRRRRASRGISHYTDEKSSARGLLAMLFGQKKGRQLSSPRPLDEPHIEPYTHNGNQSPQRASGNTSSTPRAKSGVLQRTGSVSNTDHTRTGKSQPDAENSTTAVTSSDAGSSDAAGVLRGEVEDLRREVEEIRAMRVQEEPPPEYQIDEE